MLKYTLKKINPDLLNIALKKITIDEIYVSSIAVWKRNLQQNKIRKERNFVRKMRLKKKLQTFVNVSFNSLYKRNLRNTNDV